LVRRKHKRGYCLEFVLGMLQNECFVKVQKIKEEERLFFDGYVELE
jgi:hypothetical protein